MDWDVIGQGLLTWPTGIQSYPIRGNLVVISTKPSHLERNPSHDLTPARCDLPQWNRLMSYDPDIAPYNCTNVWCTWACNIFYQLQIHSITYVFSELWSCSFSVPLEGDTNSIQAGNFKLPGRKLAVAKLSSILHEWGGNQKKKWSRGEKRQKREKTYVAS